MSVTTRPAQPQDAAAMADLLNAIIAIGGTTAHQRPFDAARMQAHYIDDPQIIATTVAEIDGAIVGYQCLAWPDPDHPNEPDSLPSDWSYIATFVQVGRTGQGIGGALFAVTKAAAQTAGAVTIDATIRADNTGGLHYYDSMGFVDYAILPDVPLRDGMRVDRIRKRFDL